MGRDGLEIARQKEVQVVAEQGAVQIKQDGLDVRILHRGLASVSCSRLFWPLYGLIIQRAKLCKVHDFARLEILEPFPVRSAAWQDPPGRGTASSR